MKFLPEFSPVLLFRAMEIWGWSFFLLQFLLLWMSQQQARKLRQKLHPKFRQKLRPTCPLPSKRQTSPKTSLCRNPLLKWLRPEYFHAILGAILGLITQLTSPKIFWSNCLSRLATQATQSREVIRATIAWNNSRKLFYVIDYFHDYGN